MNHWKVGSSAGIGKYIPNELIDRPKAGFAPLAIGLHVSTGWYIFQRNLWQVMVILIMKLYEKYGRNTFRVNMIIRISYGHY